MMVTLSMVMDAPVAASSKKVSTATVEMPQTLTAATKNAVIPRDSTPQLLQLSAMMETTSQMMDATLIAMLRQASTARMVTQLDQIPAMRPVVMVPTTAT
jgi:hypothetical protein